VSFWGSEGEGANEIYWKPNKVILKKKQLPNDWRINKLPHLTLAILSKTMDNNILEKAQKLT
jgi:hypothetical protein